MMEFKQQPIRQRQTIGEQLHHARQSSGYSLEYISERLKIAKRYLVALEGGRYNDMPSPVYIKNFLRRYSRALGIEWEDIADLYEQEISVYQKDIPQPLVDQKIPSIQKKRKKSTEVIAHQRRPLEIPQLFKFGAVGFIIVLFVVYFGWELVRLVTPPNLVIIHPEVDLVVNSQKINVVGLTEPEAIVEINGQRVSVEPDGTFAEEVFLNEGLNTLRVTARSKRSRERIVVQNVLYDFENDPDRVQFQDINFNSTGSEEAEENSIELEGENTDIP